MGNITLDYETAIERAKKLKQAATLCSYNKTAVEAQIKSIKEGIDGLAAKALLEKLEAWKKENELIESELIAASTALTKAAETIREADIAASRVTAGTSAGNSSGSGSISGRSKGGSLI